MLLLRYRENELSSQVLKLIWGEWHNEISMSTLNQKVPDSNPNDSLVTQLRYETPSNILVK